MSTALPKVVNIILTGGAWKNGWRIPGRSDVDLEDGRRLQVDAADQCGFDGVLDAVEGKADTSRMRERLDEWVKTGVMPPHVPEPKKE